jgi:hypothetical protein
MRDIITWLGLPVFDLGRDLLEEKNGANYNKKKHIMAL